MSRGFSVWISTFVLAAAHLPIFCRPTKNLYLSDSVRWASQTSLRQDRGLSGDVLDLKTCCQALSARVWFVKALACASTKNRKHRESQWNRRHLEFWMTRAPSLNTVSRDKIMAVVRQWHDTGHVFSANLPWRKPNINQWQSIVINGDQWHLWA